MSEERFSSLADHIRGHGDPRLKVLWYLAWYGILWVGSFDVLIALFALQFGLSITMHVFRGTSGKTILVVTCVGLALTVFSLFVGNESPRDLTIIWCKWGVIMLATFNTAMGMELAELFAGLNAFRIPQTFVFTLGIAVRTIPLVIEEVRRISFARMTWGHRPASGLRKISYAAIGLWETLIPTLLGIMERAEKMWFTIELRGLRNRLYRPSPGESNRRLDALVIISGLIPLISIVASLSL